MLVTSLIGRRVHWSNTLPGAKPHPSDRQEGEVVAVYVYHERRVGLLILKDSGELTDKAADAVTVQTPPPFTPPLPLAQLPRGWGGG